MYPNIRSPTTSLFPDELFGHLANAISRLLLGLSRIVVDEAIGADRLFLPLDHWVQHPIRAR
jgi:hypothetical protein